MKEGRKGRSRNQTTLPLSADGAQLARKQSQGQTDAKTRWLEAFRSGKGKDVVLQDVIQLEMIADLAQDQYGSRFIQQKLECATLQELEVTHEHDYTSPNSHVRYELCLLWLNFHLPFLRSHHTLILTTGCFQSDLPRDPASVHGCVW